jgi:hypothetical protein
MKGTVALPLWNMPDITWLFMESLCNQIKPCEGWELVIFEDGENQLGEDFFYSYEERLSQVGCEQIKYFNSENRYPLSMKWIMIASQSEGDYYCLCAGDNYYSPYMLIEAEKYSKEADWCVTTKGYIYDINLDKVCRYDFFAPFGLQMTAKTELVKRFKFETVNKGVDKWFSNHIKDKMIYEPKRNTLITNGRNHISYEREELFIHPASPYYKTKTKLENIIPVEIAKKLRLCRKSQ